MGELRSMAPPFVASGLCGAAVRTRLKHLTPDDGKVLRLVSAHLGALASQDLKARCRDGLSHSIEHRLSQPIGQQGTKHAPGGYRSQREWHAKSRRLRVLQDRLTTARADREAGFVHVVRGGKRLARTRHHLQEAGLTEAAWRGRW